MFVPKVRDIYRRIGFTKYKRIEMYLETLENKVVITGEKDIKTIQDIQVLMSERLKAVRSLYAIVTFSYFGIYASFVTIILGDILVFSEIASFWSDIIGFFGTTLFFLLLFFSNKMSDLYYQDLNLLAAHAISIYNKYDTINRDEAVFEDMNNYISFINFFKKRYQ